MKKLFLLALTSVVSVCMMAAGDGTGLDKANAIEFKWATGVEHRGDTTTEALWYRVDLSPLKDEENPSLTLYLTNPNRDKSVTVSMNAKVMGNSESKTYTIAPYQHKTYTENASMLIKVQDVIYLTLKSDDRILLSAKVFEAADLDETCANASTRTLKWDTEFTQTAGYAAWWKLDLMPIKEVETKDVDAKITITNLGSDELTLKAGQSLDCPSSGLTKRSYTIAANGTMVDTIPASMINSVQPTEIYFSLENNQPVRIKVEKIKRPATIQPVIKITDPYEDRHVDKDTIKHMPAARLYRYDLKEMRDTVRYEPEFSYRNVGAAPAKVTVKMAFELPAYNTSDAVYELAPGEEAVVVYTKNMLDGMGADVQYIYLLTYVEGDVEFSSRFKHIREGKRCKNNIDFDWEKEYYTQDARAKLWYQVVTTEKREAYEDIIVHVLNQGNGEAQINATLAFDCAAIDRQEISRSIKNGKELTYTIAHSMYSMMQDTVWVGIESSENLKFWLTTQKVQMKAEADSACMVEKGAKEFEWKGISLEAGSDVWYRVSTDTLKTIEKFPTFYIYNRGNKKATITAELSLDCPDSIPNQKRTLTIPANGVYKNDSITRATFHGIYASVVYLHITTNQKIDFEMLTTTKPAGSACEAAIPFSWEIGNYQKAGDDIWYEVDLRKALSEKKDVKVKVTNEDGKDCSITGWWDYDCSGEETPSSRAVTLKANEYKERVIENSVFQSRAKDSVMYIRVKGTTALHLEAELVDPAPFDPIAEDDPAITLIPIQWNQSYTQTADTAWYYISNDELNIVRTTSYTPQATITNLAGASNKVRVDYAFHFPITQTMMNHSWTMKADESVSETVGPNDMKQYTTNDSVLIRIIAKGKIEFSTTLVNPYDGSDCSEAIRIGFEEQVVQEANTIRWYRINIAKLKQTPNLHGKSLHIKTRNTSDKSATIQVGLYESCEGTDMFSGYEKYSKRTIGGNKHASKSIPAYVLYGLADNDVYVRVETDRRLTFVTRFEDYDVAEADPNQQKAKLLVPNVDYYIPADTTVWYRACFPYLLNNYAAQENSCVTFRNLGTGDATVTGTAAFQDTLTYKVPTRTRTISAGRSGTWTWRELAKEAAKRKGRTLDLEDTKLEFVDSIVRHYVNSEDHIAAQIRIHTTQPLYVRVDNVTQTKGDKIGNPMEFDWEHGNVNPKDQETWYVVRLDEGIERVKEKQEIRLHVTNWSDAPCQATATVHLDRGTDKAQQRTITYTLGANEDKWKNIDRKLLIGESNPLIDFTSEADVHIWAEVVEARDRDSVVVRDTIVACDGVDLTDPYTGDIHTINFPEPYAPIQWRDSDSFINDTAMAEWDSICYITVVRPIDPTTYEIKDIPAANQLVIEKGAVIDYSKADQWLRNKLTAEKLLNDTIKAVDTILWERSINDNNDAFEPIPLTAIDTAAQVIRYRVVTECDKDTITSELFYNTLRDTLVVKTCGSYTWIVKNPAGGDAKNQKYEESKFDSVKITLNNGCIRWAYLNLTIDGEVTRGNDFATICKDDLATYTWHGKSFTQGGAYPDWDTVPNHLGCDSIISFYLTVNEATRGDDYDTICAADLATYTWHGKSFTAGGDYKDLDTVANAVKCDSIISFHLTVNEATKGDTTAAECAVFTWYENTCDASKDYYHTFKNAAGCDSVVTLHFTLNPTYAVDTTATACNLFEWRGDTYTASGDYTYSTATAAGCDSVVTLHLTVNYPYVKTLRLVHKYNDRLLMIDRIQINEELAKLDGELQLDIEEDTALVHWYKVASPADELVGTGYYLTNKSGEADGAVLQPGQTYYAKIDIPGKDGKCGFQAETMHITTGKAKAAPALVPSLAMPGEDIQVINLDPEVQTSIRIYTTEGLLQRAYTVSGEESFTIKAANDHGFYLVELSDESMKSTLRYIVK